MKISSLLLVISLITGQASRFVEEITITRTTSDKQIEAAEGKIQKEYGFKADIQVLSRNSKGEIANLTCVVYQKSGGGQASCSSDDFGTLVINKEGGCSITDQVHEKKKL